MPNKSNPVVAMLRADHKKVKELFAEYEEGDSRKQQTIAETAMQELNIHAELEERLIYPAIRQEIDADDLMNEANEEHHVAHVLLAELKTLPSNDARFKAKFTVLGEVVKHHIQEEEGEIFPKAQKTKIDWKGLYEQVRHRKDRLLAKAA